jgi:hypothetical protein
MKTLCSILSFLLVSFLLWGCNRNPNVEIAGSYFPGWMISLTVAIALTLVTHTLLRRKNLLEAAGPPIAFYPTLVVLLTCLMWLCFFA